MKPKQIEIILAVLAVLLYAGTPAKAINIDDGQNHVFSDATYASELVDIDLNVANNPGTHVQVVDGAAVGWIGAGYFSTVQVDGGTIYMGMSSFDNAAITVNGGTVYGLRAAGQSLVNLNSGTIHGGIIASDYGTMNIRGGIFSGLTTDRYTADHAGTIYLYGDKFSVDGHPLQYGENLRDYGVISGSNLTGTVTGRLLDGSLLDSSFHIENVNSGGIIVVPEPCTIALFGLGLPLIRAFSKRKI